MKSRRIVFTLGFAMALVLTACFPTPTPSAPPTTDVKIVSPVEGGKVDQTETVKGTSQLIPDGSVLWVVVFLPSVGRYYPQNNPADMQANGEWSTVVYVGQTADSGLEADIVAVLANKDAQAAFSSYLQDAKDKNDYPGLERIPNGAMIYHRISVVRR